MSTDNWASLTREQQDQAWADYRAAAHEYLARPPAPAPQTNAWAINSAFFACGAISMIALGVPAIAGAAGVVAAITGFVGVYRAQKRGKTLLKLSLAGAAVGLISVLAACSSTSAVSTAPLPATASSPTSTTSVAAAAAGEITSGTYEVGVDIQPGKYKTTGTGGAMGCYWARLSSTEGSFDSIISNGYVDGPGVFTVKSSDKALQLTGSCTWTKVS